MKYTDEELLDEVRRLKEELGHPPTLQEFRNQSEHSATTYYNRFGSWSDAVELAEFSPRKPESKIETRSLIEDLHAVAKRCEGSPTVTMMNRHGEYSASAYKERFGSWNRALNEAGFDSNTFDTNIPESDLLAELQNLSENAESAPTYEQMEEDGKYGARTYIRRFGSWEEALDKAGFNETNIEQEVSESELRDELERVATGLGKQPTAQEMREIGTYAVSTYQRHFGTWSNALKAVFDE